MIEIIGREQEKKILVDALASKEAELVAIYGRRRVGKTFLIRNFFKKEMVFEFSGQHNAKMNIQLENFSKKLDEYKKVDFPTVTPRSWNEAFERLKKYLESKLARKNKCVVFFDEFPWIESPRANFVSSFEYFWNDWASTQPTLMVIICGSAASWMIRKVIQNKGGLHNRISRKIRLLPFTLYETERFLKSRSIVLDRFQIVQLYMVFGGIPHYLKEIQKGQSFSQSVNNVCFNKDGLLHNEFQELFASLFKNHEKHILLIRELAQKRGGLTRNELIEKTNISSGGTVSEILDELEESGFIKGYPSFGLLQKNTIYKLIDEYSLFYLKFIEKNKTKNWEAIQNTASWRSWSGLTFESINHKHIRQIKQKLGISGIYSDESSWRFDGTSEENGCQIDLLIDRKDNCINLCEIKFAESEFTIDKKYAEEIHRKITVFKQKTGTRKTIFFTAISTYGLKPNEHKLRWVQNEIVLDDLFSPSNL
ncbi:MAG: ATP-binding protein [Spirosomataceae bacterium]